jgi:hypothetical protein
VATRRCTAAAIGSKLREWAKPTPSRGRAALLALLDERPQLPGEHRRASWSEIALEVSICGSASSLRDETRALTQVGMADPDGDLAVARHRLQTWAAAADFDVLESHAACTSFGFNRKGPSALANSGLQDQSEKAAQQWNSRFERDVPNDLGSTGLINDAYIATVVLDGQARNYRVRLMTRGLRSQDFFANGQSRCAESPHSTNFGSWSAPLFPLCPANARHPIWPVLDVKQHFVQLLRCRRRRLLNSETHVCSLVAVNQSGLLPAEVYRLVYLVCKRSSVTR